MSSTDDHAHDHDADPITDRVHDNSWSANLEKPQYAEDVDLALSHAVDAIEHTTAGNHVNLVTHGDLGHPKEYLFATLDELDSVDYEYVEQCGCGGHVTKVHVE